MHILHQFVCPGWTLLCSGHIAHAPLPKAMCPSWLTDQCENKLYISLSIQDGQSAQVICHPCARIVSIQMDILAHRLMWEHIRHQFVHPRWTPFCSSHTLSLLKALSHQGFRNFQAVYSTLKMKNDSFNFYFHILMLVKFEIIVVNKISIEISHIVWHIMLDKMANK